MGSGGCEEEIVSLLIPGNGNKKTPSDSRHGTRAKLKQVKCVTYYGVQESRITSFWKTVRRRCVADQLHLQPYSRYERQWTNDRTGSQPQFSKRGSSQTLMTNDDPRRLISVSDINNLCSF